jgi:PDZ domain-containing secreted protein
MAGQFALRSMSFCQNLHAKFYANESQSLICSLNLYDFSQINNHELGVLIVKDEDREAFNASITEAQRLIRISTENIPSPASLQTADSDSKKNQEQKKMFRNHPQKVTIKLTYLLMIKPLIWMTAQAKTMKLMPSLQIN